MNLTNPVTIQPPSITRKDGTVRTFKPITLSSLDITLIDNPKRKSCVAKITPFPNSLVLWQGNAYDSIGDYTQKQAEDRISELLGSNAKDSLEKLFLPKK